VTISSQDPEIIAQLDRLEMALDRTSTMLSLLYITEELRDVSTSSDEEGNASPQLDLAGPDMLELDDNDGDDVDT
jgi:hypothetical protein